MLPMLKRHLEPVPEDAAELQRLLDGVARGERAARGQFFDRYEAEVNRLVWSLLGADADHDDIVQDTFQSLFHGAQGVKSISALRGWVRTVTVNCVRQVLRRRRWLRIFTDASEGLNHPDLRIADEDTRERARHLWRRLQRLNERDRLVLVLRHIEGYELTELAEAMSCSLATVKRWLAAAEEHLSQENDV
ncbi:MAG: sigma-70 family RNA polymerase sigma factor [Archangium sp.]|nr:sigma-70 family RNA polymerase sigma factor [Archangium sp.]